jgi:hypothetical protein
MKEIAYLTARPGLSAEERAGLRYARGAGAVRLSFASLPDAHTLLGRFRCLWWHYDTSTALPPSALTSHDLDILRRYVEAGGSLLLTLLAAQYICDLGFESVRPNPGSGRFPWTPHL